jgi:hypothetical protein
VLAFLEHGGSSPRTRGWSQAGRRDDRRYLVVPAAPRLLRRVKPLPAVVPGLGLRRQGFHEWVASETARARRAKPRRSGRPSASTPNTAHLTIPAGECEAAPPRPANRPRGRGEHLESPAGVVDRPRIIPAAAGIGHVDHGDAGCADYSFGRCRSGRSRALPQRKACTRRLNEFPNMGIHAQGDESSDGASCRFRLLSTNSW